MELEVELSVQSPSSLESPGEDSGGAGSASAAPPPLLSDSPQKKVSRRGRRNSVDRRIIRRIKIYVHSIIGLPNCPLDGSAPSPSFLIQAGAGILGSRGPQDVWETEVVPDTNNPVWNSSFEISIPEDTLVREVGDAKTSTPGHASPAVGSSPSWPSRLNGLLMGAKDAKSGRFLMEFLIPFEKLTSLHTHNIQVVDREGAMAYLTIQVQRLKHEDLSLFEERPQLNRLMVTLERIVGEYQPEAEELVPVVLVTQDLKSFKQGVEEGKDTFSIPHSKIDLSESEPFDALNYVASPYLTKPQALFPAFEENQGLSFMESCLIIQEKAITQPDATVVVELFARNTDRVMSGTALSQSSSHLWPCNLVAFCSVPIRKLIQEERLVEEGCHRIKVRAPMYLVSPEAVVRRKDVKFQLELEMWSGSKYLQHLQHESQQGSLIRSPSTSVFNDPMKPLSSMRSASSVENTAAGSSMGPPPPRSRSQLGDSSGVGRIPLGNLDAVEDSSPQSSGIPSAGVASDSAFARGRSPSGEGGHTSPRPPLPPPVSHLNRGTPSPADFPLPRSASTTPSPDIKTVVPPGPSARRRDKHVMMVPERDRDEFQVNEWTDNTELSLSPISDTGGGITAEPSPMERQQRQRATEAEVKAQKGQLREKEIVISRLLSTLEEKYAEVRQLQMQSDQAESKTQYWESRCKEMEIQLEERASMRVSYELEPKILQLPHEELLTQYKTLMEDYGATLHQLSRCEVKLQRLNNDMLEKNEETKRLVELEKAHKMQSQVLQRMHSERGKYKSYKATSETQKEVIAKLENLLRMTSNENKKLRQAVRNAGVTDAELRQVTDAQRSEEKEEISRLQVMMEEEQVKHEQEVQRLERELKETEARLGELEAASRERADAMQNSFRAPGLEEGDEGTTSGDSEEQQGLKEELEKLRKERSSLMSEKITLMMRAERAEAKVRALEDQIMKNAADHSKQMSQLRISMANAGKRGKFGGKFAGRGAVASSSGAGRAAASLVAGAPAADQLLPKLPEFGNRQSSVSPVGIGKPVPISLPTLRSGTTSPKDTSPR